MNAGVLGWGLLALSWLVVAGCDPADSLTNDEYRAYLGRWNNKEAPAVVAALNQLETKLNGFKCRSELEVAQRALWREKVGTVEPPRLPEIKTFRTCLQGFYESSGVKQGLIEQDVLTVWVNHNFLPAIQKTIEAEVATSQKRLDGAGCGGEECDGLIVVGDLAVPRVGLERPVAWWDAKAACREARFGGLGPWRLPTKAELTEIRESNKVASELAKTNFWSGERLFEESGRLQAWVLRFDLAAKAEGASPEQLPFDHRGRPRLGKVRCVHDMAKSPAPANAVDDMEQSLVDLGCPEGWYEAVRIREKHVVTWGRKGTGIPTCGEINYCGLSWEAPSKALAKALGEDAWFGSPAQCVASLPEAQ